MSHDIDEGFSLQLTHDEALILFEWLASHDDLPVDHPAEQDVLWRIEGALEKTLAEIIAPNYGANVEAARERVHSTRG